MKCVPVFLAVVGFSLPVIVDGNDVGTASLSISPAHVQIQVGQEISIRAEVRSANDLFGAPFYLNFDPHLLEVTKVSSGGFLKNSGKQEAFIHKVDKEKGRIIVGLTRLGNVSGVSGDGTLAQITFKAMQPGGATLSFQKVDFRNRYQVSLPVRSQTARIEIR